MRRARAVGVTSTPIVARDGRDRLPSKSGTNVGRLVGRQRQAGPRRLAPSKLMLRRCRVGERPRTPPRRRNNSQRSAPSSRRSSDTGKRHCTEILDPAATKRQLYGRPYMRTDMPRCRSNHTRGGRRRFRLRYKRTIRARLLHLVSL